MLTDYSADTRLGRMLRRADAKLMLERLHQIERAIADQEASNTRVSDSIDRLKRQEELDVRFLMQFGIELEHRHHFRHLLQQTVCSGSLTLQQAADSSRECIHNSKGDLSSSSGD